MATIGFKDIVFPREYYSPISQIFSEEEWAVFCANAEPMISKPTAGKRTAGCLIVLLVFEAFLTFMAFMMAGGSMVTIIVGAVFIIVAVIELYFIISKCMVRTQEPEMAAWVHSAMHGAHFHRRKEGISTGYEIDVPAPFLQQINFPTQFVPFMIGEMCLYPTGFVHAHRGPVPGPALGAIKIQRFTETRNSNNEHKWSESDPDFVMPQMIPPDFHFWQGGFDHDMHHYMHQQFILALERTPIQVITSPMAFPNVMRPPPNPYLGSGGGRGVVVAPPPSGTPATETTRLLSQFPQQPQAPPQPFLIVTDLVPGGAAAQAGVQRGDGILSFGNITMGNVATIQEVARSFVGGHTIPIRVLRQGQVVEMRIIWSGVLGMALAPPSQSII